MSLKTFLKKQVDEGRMSETEICLITNRLVDLGRSAPTTQRAIDAVLNEPNFSPSDWVEFSHTILREHAADDARLISAIQETMGRIGFDLGRVIAHAWSSSNEVNFRIPKGKHLQLSFRDTVFSRVMPSTSFHSILLKLRRIDTPDRLNFRHWLDENRENLHEKLSGLSGPSGFANDTPLGDYLMWATFNIATPGSVSPLLKKVLGYKNPRLEILLALGLPSSWFSNALLIFNYNLPDGIVPIKPTVAHAWAGPFNYYYRSEPDAEGANPRNCGWTGAHPESQAGSQPEAVHALVSLACVTKKDGVQLL